MKIDTPQNRAALATYLRSVIAAVTAVASTGNHSTSDLCKAAAAALLPPLMRWANPKDASYGLTK
jgi:hypothetical protein